MKLNTCIYNNNYFLIFCSTDLGPVLRSIIMYHLFDTKSLHNSILCGPVSSSVFIEDCKDCTFVVACQQLRVHGTVQSLFYLHVTSRAIIEDCRQVSFAPYNLTYPELEQHFKVVLMFETECLRVQWNLRIKDTLGTI